MRFIVTEEHGRVRDGNSIEEACQDFYNLWRELNLSYDTKVKIDQLERKVIWSFTYKNYTIERC